MTRMRAVDVYSQRESYARIGRKTPRWWPQFAWFMIDMAANNASVLYKRRVTGPNLRPIQFREQLMAGLVGDFTQRKKRGRPEKVKFRADEPHHIPVKLPASKPCMVCTGNMWLVMGEHKPRVSVRCQWCGRASSAGRSTCRLSRRRTNRMGSAIAARVPRQVHSGFKGYEPRRYVQWCPMPQRGWVHAYTQVREGAT